MVEGITYAPHLSSIASSMYLLLLLCRINWSVAGNYVLCRLGFKKTSVSTLVHSDPRGGEPGPQVRDSGPGASRVVSVWEKRSSGGP